MKHTFCLSLALLVAPAFAGNNHNFTYLALGDSVPFGMNVTLLPPFSNALPTPSEFIGYPEPVAELDRLIGLNKLVNAACPGETSGSFLDIKTPDNGCNSSHVDPSFPPFKTTVGLHVNYKDAQIAFAEAQLQSDKNIKLVTLSIGANDILLVLPDLEKCGADAGCQQNVLGPVLSNYAVNLGQILTRIRAKYSGMLMLMTYYSPAPALDGVTQALNSVMTQVGGGFHITVADGYDAFRIASAPFNNDPCQAGLLIKLPTGAPTPCDVHPSALGRVLLAATVEFAALGLNF
jgi:lysophospholipase L1-like esterase